MYRFAQRVSDRECDTLSGISSAATLMVCQGVLVMVDNTVSPAFIIVSAGDIAVRAYEIYVARGRADGSDREDWLQAERELKSPGSVARGTSQRRSKTL
jgi:DUF2934 family protein